MTEAINCIKYHGVIYLIRLNKQIREQIDCSQWFQLEVLVNFNV